MSVPVDISTTIKFRDFVPILEHIKKASNSAKKEIYIKRYYDSFKSHRQAFRAEQGLESLESGSSSFYSVLRCLIPSADSARQPYGLQVNSLGKVYKEILQLPADSNEALRLMTRSHPNGDYADLVFSVLKTRCRSEAGDYNLMQIHKMLDSIASDDRANTKKVLTQLMENSSALEQKWFIRLLLKTMQLGITQEKVLNVLHPEAKTLFLRCNDLNRVCKLLADNRLEDDNNVASSIIEPLQFVRPQLCETFPGNVEPLMAADVLYVETKMDGERFQLHYLNGQFKYISRNGVDYSLSFGANYDSGKLTPMLQELMPVGLKSIILDGEMMVWNGSRFCVKGANTDVKHLKRADHQPCFVAYDLLYLNGKSLLEVPYVQRSYKLREILTEREGVLQVMKPIKLSSIEQFKDIFQAALNDNEEGVVLKKQNASYRPGTRNGGGWYKAKADYITGLTTEFDVLIMGGFYNSSKSFIESFLLGALKYTSDSQYEIFSIGKVTNITQQRVVLCDRLRPDWHDCSMEPPPMWYHYVQNSAEGRPDLWIDPRKSIILQIKATDLSPTGQFAASKCLHFPRVEAWRNDKLWHECLSIEEYESMCKSSTVGGVNKLTKRELNLQDITTEREKKLSAAQKRNLGIKAYERRIELDKIETTSKVFDGFSICILSACIADGKTPEDLKTLVVQNSGELYENPMPNDPRHICVAGDIPLRVKGYIDSKKYNVASIKWFLRTVRTQHLKLTPRDLLGSTEEVREQLTQMYDDFGDSYTEFVTPSELREIIAGISSEEASKVSDKEVKALKARLML